MNAGARVRWATLLAWSGIAAMAVVGIWMTRYTAFWLDPDEGCALRGQCEDPAMLRLGWVLLALGGVVVLIGVLWRGIVIEREPEGLAPGKPEGLGPRTTRGTTEGAVVIALATGLFGLICLFAFFVLGMGSAQLGVAAVAAFWLGQAHAIAALVRTVRDTGGGRAWVTGLLASTAAVGCAGVVLAFTVRPSESSPAVVGTWAAAATVVAVVSWSVSAVRRPATIP